MSQQVGEKARPELKTENLKVKSRNAGQF